MRYYEVKIDPYLRFNSLHTIDNIGWKPKLKLLSDYDLVFVKKNSISIMSDSETHVINENEAFFACPGHTVYIKPNAEERTGVFVLHFTAASHKMRTFSEITNILQNQTKTSVYDSNIYLSSHIRIKHDAVHKILKKMIDEQKYRRYGYRAILDICTLEILYELSRICSETVLFGNVEYNYTATNSYVRSIIDYLHNNYMKKMTSADVETHLNLCYDYANFIFKRITGFTIMNYLNNIRMNRAKDLMDTTSMSISDIAELVGFTDPQYFSKKFRDFDGRSPSQYKKA